VVRQEQLGAARVRPVVELAVRAVVAPRRAVRGLPEVARSAGAFRAAGLLRGVAGPGQVPVKEARHHPVGENRRRRGSGGFTSYDDTQTRQQLSEWTEKERIPRVKIKIGESWGGNEHRDLARAELAREVIGPDAELYVDANGGYSVGQAVRVADELAAMGVTWFEEPVSSQDLAGLAAIREQVRPDVAAGEYSWSLADSARLIHAGAVGCLQLDVTRCGGISEFLRGAALATAHNLQVSGHCAPNLHAHVGAAVPNLRHVEYFHDHQRIERMLFEGTLDPSGGVMRPDPDRPGHGLALRTADAERYRRG
jgi:L-alanine-DL-glutamate epimerase-like enolase superfamily enzyme